jgi:hypothetical protein
MTAEAQLQTAVFRMTLALLGVDVLLLLTALARGWL